MLPIILYESKKDNIPHCFKLIETDSVTTITPNFMFTAGELAKQIPTLNSQCNCQIFPAHLSSLCPNTVCTNCNYIGHNKYICLFNEDDYGNPVYNDTRVYYKTRPNALSDFVKSICVCNMIHRRNKGCKCNN